MKNTINEYDQIKTLLKRSRALTEQIDNRQSIDDTSSEDTKPEEKREEFTVSGGKIVVHGYETEDMKVTDEESAHTAREIVKKEGLFVGYTSGAALQAVKQFAKEGEFTSESNVVVIFPDHGSRYMSKIYNEEWMEEQGFFDASNESHQNIQYIKDITSKK